MNGFFESSYIVRDVYKIQFVVNLANLPPLLESALFPQLGYLLAEWHK